MPSALPAGPTRAALALELQVFCAILGGARTVQSLGLSGLLKFPARDFVYSLHSTKRSCLLKELHYFKSIAVAQEKLEALPPTPGQLRHVFFHNAIPFIGFASLDNAIMIIAGTKIELSIGIILGISTMAVNMLSVPSVYQHVI